MSVVICPGSLVELPIRWDVDFFLSVSGHYRWHGDVFLSCNASINFLWVLLRGGRGIHERISWNHVWMGDAKWDTVVIMACILWAVWKQIPWWQCQAALPQCGKPVLNREGDLQGASNSVLVHFQNELMQAFSFSKMFYLMKKFMVTIKNVKKNIEEKIKMILLLWHLVIWRF